MYINKKKIISDAAVSRNQTLDGVTGNTQPEEHWKLLASVVQRFILIMYLVVNIAGAAVVLFLGLSKRYTTSVEDQLP